MLDTRVLGENIKDLRKRRGLTQQAFAEVMGVSFQAVSSWERGITPPELGNLVAIAQFFGVPIDRLLNAGTESLYLGIDGGGTKTELVIVTAEGYVRWRARLGGCNPNDIGYEKAAELLLRGIDGALTAYPSVKAAFLGIAGAASGDYARRIRCELEKRYPGVAFRVENDAHSLLSLEEGTDMALIGGTGSVVFVRNGDGYERLGGWGHLLDASGSAYGIGKDALCLALGEEDMKEERSLLGTLLLRKLDTATVWESIGTVYKGGKPYVAALASVVFDAYIEGDEGAKSIIDTNARAIAELLNTGMRLYGVKGVTVASGGLFEHYGEIMTDHIARYTSARIKISDLAPIYGACKRACAISGERTSESFHDNFKSTYGGIAE